MQARVFRFTEGTPFYWVQPDFLFIAEGREDHSSFRKSFFKQGDEALYGDNAVTHYTMKGKFQTWMEDDEGRAIHLGQELEIPYEGGDSWLSFRVWTVAYTNMSGFVSYEGNTCWKNRYGEWGYKSSQVIRHRSYWKEGELWVRQDWISLYNHETQDLTAQEIIELCEGKPPSDWWTGYDKPVIDRQGRVLSGPVHFSCMANVIQPTLPYDTYNTLVSRRTMGERQWSQVDNLIRDTIMEETTLATNNFANIKQAADLIRSIGSFSWTNCLREARSAWHNIMVASGRHPAFSSIDSEQAKRLVKEGRRVLRNKTAKYAGDAWLKYRYAYNTTKMDVEQATRVISKGLLKPLTPERVLRGRVNIVDGEARVKMRLHENTGDMFAMLMLNSDKVGLMPSLYNLWDMVPFSFVVDWVYPIGDILQDIDQRWYYRAYKVDELLVSFKQKREVTEYWGDTSYSWYDRILMDEFPQWTICEDDNGASTRVWSWRANDTIVLSSNLLLGGK